ncbi:unnamed protein product [Polarella glacialis]|uniref:Uncharacterized protein n=1 Tax=Polarella glacialis TaxID=89957 RepID=A0A813DE32_POLGL|nr:unnamed protein product [Polarella glacialis]
MESCTADLRKLQFTDIKVDAPSRHSVVKEADYVPDLCSVMQKGSVAELVSYYCHFHDACAILRASRVFIHPHFRSTLRVCRGIMLCGGFTLNRTICNSADRKAWSTLPPMSQPRTAAADAVDGSHLYLCGGSTSLDMATGRNETLRCSESYDALLEQWTPLPLMADLRLQAMAVWWAGRLYVFGGHHCNAPPVNMPERPTTSVQCFDPLWNNGTWNDLAPMSHGRVNAACLAAPEGIYLCGGESDSLGRGVLAASERFDTVRGSWEALPPLAGGPRTKAFSARIADAVFACGGMGGSPGQSALRSVECFALAATTTTATATAPTIPASGQWVARSPMNEARFSFGFSAGSAVVAGLLYICSGNRENFASVERFHPALDRWESVAPMSELRVMCMVGEAAGLLFVFGGMEPRSEAKSSCECFDPALGRWTALPPMPGPRYGACIAGVTVRSRYCKPSQY